jgi:Domain of unknown function (DUF4386)
VANAPIQFAAAYTRKPMKATHSLQDQTASTPATTGKGRDYLLGGLLIFDALLSIVPVVILGAAIGWPASLGKPAAEQLSAIYANAGAVTLGYSIYLLYSILIAPVMIGLTRRVFGNLSDALPATVVAFAVLSTLARSIGILRWLTVMPVLATLHAASRATNEATKREQIELVFSALTTYGGGIGEILGVSLFMAISVATLCVGTLLKGGMPTWLSISGFASAGLIGALAAPTFGAPNLVPVALAVSVLSAWMLAVGIWCIFSKRTHP